MKDQLVSVVAQFVRFCAECQDLIQSEWFELHLGLFMENEVDSEKFQNALCDIKYVLGGGMGSFTDQRFIPGPQSSMTISEARSKQWTLVEKFDELLPKLLIAPCPGQVSKVPAT